ncbi:transposase, IS4 family [Epsilonproteobacteria bacterium SCGC AD-308-P11]|jgi:transposase, IS5 family|nr:transposase, IS4 family [Epsilonproteobacteria bacterium SCGC AD-308-P11]
MAGLFDYEFQLEKINQHQPPLNKLNKVINWEIFRAPIEEALYVEPKAPGGRPPYDKLMMFKIVILQKYYNLSDEQTEFQIKDRLSFMQFLGLQIGDNVPDEKTIWLFKENLKEKKLSKTLFELFTSQLVNKGIVAREGSMVDASFVDVPRQRNSREDNADIKKGAIPLEFAKNKAKLSQKDTDAKWMTKNNERHYGYKNHVNADAKTKLITKFSVSSAAPHDSTELESIVNENDNILYADSAYRSAKIEEYLETKQCKSHVHEKGYRNNPLDAQQKLANSMKSKIRARVEHIFGFMTNSMNDALHMTSIGIKRIESNIGFLNLTYNLFRYEQLVRLQKVKIM